MFLSAQYARNTLVLRKTLSAEAKLSESAAQILSQRRRALGVMKETQKHSVLGHNAALVLMFKDLAQTLKQDALLIENFNLRDQQLEIRFKSGADEDAQNVDVSVPDLVARLESVPSLENVSVALGQLGAITLRAQIVQPQNGQGGSK